MRFTHRETEAETSYRLWCAATQRRVVTVTYIDDKEGETIRTIEPYIFKQSKDGNVRLMAMCRLRKSLRSFRVDRIVSYTIHRGKFVLDDPFDSRGDEFTNWWKFTESDSDEEIGRMRITVPEHVSNGDVHRYIYRQAVSRSSEIRAASAKCNGLGMRRLRRKEVHGNAA